MYAENDHIDRRTLATALADRWQITAASMNYQPVGFGSHHYAVVGSDGARWFVTVDDLVARGEDTETALDQLDRALRTTLHLHRAGLEFVHPPSVGDDGTVVARFDGFAASVFAYVDGTSNPFGEHGSDADRRWVLRALGRLHAATGRIPADVPRRDDLAIPRREEFFRSLSDLDTPWTGGPYAEPAREALARRVNPIRRLFDTYDELAAALLPGSDTWVVTHGEPHAANLLHTDAGTRLLIDWDTVAIAPRERDLWQVQPRNDDEWSAYAAYAGSAQLDQRAIRLYQLSWQLTELCLYTADFRAPHVQDANTRTAWGGFTGELPPD